MSAPAGPRPLEVQQVDAMFGALVSAQRDKMAAFAAATEAETAVEDFFTDYDMHGPQLGIRFTREEEPLYAWADANDPVGDYSTVRKVHEANISEVFALLGIDTSGRINEIVRPDEETRLAGKYLVTSAVEQPCIFVAHAILSKPSVYPGQLFGELKFQIGTDSDTPPEPINFQYEKLQ